jgi:hypothetical protein
MPSKNTFGYLLSKGLKVEVSKYNKYDTLENRDDLTSLFSTLDSVRDKNNRPAVMTPFVNVCNPHFEKIKESNFSGYYFEKFTDTLIKYYPDSNVFELYKEGIDSGMFLPQLHGRDHIAVQFWLNSLKNGNRDLLTAFNSGFVYLDIPEVPQNAQGFRAEFYFNHKAQMPFLHNAIDDAAESFHNIFHYKADFFAPANGIFHPDFVNTAARNGVKYLSVSHSMPYPAKSGKLKHKILYSGQRGIGGLIYYMRNCAFEPADPDYKDIGPTMNQIDIAFRWRKPAFISTHRVNFVGGLDISNKDRGLSELKKLLKAIIKKWPDIEFLGSGQAVSGLIEESTVGF